MTIRILTWNVNGIRNPFKYAPWNKERTLQSMFDILEGDIVCFQEVKTPRAALTDDLVVVDGWDSFYSFPHSQTGYSGVAVYTRDAKCIPLRVEEGVTGILKIPGTQTRYLDAAPQKQIGGYPTDQQLRRAAVGRDVIDCEGRCLILEFPLFVLINVYCPARRNQERTGYRNTFLLALDARIRNLAAMGKNVVLLGDLNITRDQLDTAGIWGHQGHKVVSEALEFDEGYMVMRAPKLLNQLLYNSRLVSDTGQPFWGPHETRRPPVLCDTGRELHPTRTGMFTCWDTRKNHRPANYGSRIDYIACSPKIMQLVQEADIQPQLHGSDHCPVYVVLRESVASAEAPDQPAHILDYLNPPGRYAHGQKALSPERDAALIKRFPQSGRRLPQFSNRRHIGNMFRQAAKPTPAPEAAAAVPSSTDEASSADAPVDLPAILKADAVALVESDDDGDMSNIEDDDSDVPNPADGDADDAESTPKPKDTKRGTVLPYHAGKAGKISSVWSSQTAKRGSDAPDAPQATAARPENEHKAADPPPAIGLEDSISLLPISRAATPCPESAERGLTPSLSQASAPSEAGGDKHKAALAWPPTPPRPKAPAPTKRSLTRARSSTSASGSGSQPTAASSSSRPAKKAKTTKTMGKQTTMSMFLKARDSPSAGPQQPQQPQQPQPRDAVSPGDDSTRPGSLGSAEPEASSKSHDAANDAEEDADAGMWMTAEEVDAAFKSRDAAKASWSKLGLGHLQAPKCEHGEPCKTLVTRKAGVNSGRSFFMCARPPGPLGKSEKGTAWQCTTFVWCRDWKPER